MQVTVKNQSGETLDSIELNDAVFNVPMNRTLVHQAMVIYQGNKRHGTHDTKTRAQVSGGGHKPWLQKHTGRARQGSTRSPQWRHGGVVFGPHPRSYRRALPRRMRRLALRCVLSEKARQGQLVCLDATDTINGKTRTMAQLLNRLDVSRSALLVTKASDEKVVLAANNVARLWTLPVNQLNAEELLSRETLIMTVEAARWAEESLAVEPHGRRGRKHTVAMIEAEEADDELVIETLAAMPEDPEDIVEEPEEAAEETVEATEEAPAPPSRRSQAATAGQEEAPPEDIQQDAGPESSPGPESPSAQETDAEEEG